MFCSLCLVVCHHREATRLEKHSFFFCCLHKVSLWGSYPHYHFHKVLFLSMLKCWKLFIECESPCPAMCEANRRSFFMLFLHIWLEQGDFSLQGHKWVQIRSIKGETLNVSLKYSAKSFITKEFLFNTTFRVIWNKWFSLWRSETWHQADSLSQRSGKGMRG